MTRRQFHLALAVLCLSGLVGGFVSGLVVPGRAAWAQAPRTVDEVPPVEPPSAESMQGRIASEEIRAQRFVMVDTAGRTRATLTVFEGEPGLALWDEAGRPRARLSIFEGDPWIGLFDEEGKPRATLHLSEGEPILSFQDEAGEARAALHLVAGAPGLRLFDAAGQIRVVLGPTETKNARTGAVTRFPISTLTLFDETGALAWQAP